MREVGCEFHGIFRDSFPEKVLHAIHWKARKEYIEQTPRETAHLRNKTQELQRPNRDYDSRRISQTNDGAF